MQQCRKKRHWMLQSVTLQGKSPSTASGEFVREEIEHVREGKYGAVGKAGDCDRAEQGTTCRDSTGSAEPEDHERGDAQKGGPGFAARRRGSCDKRGRFDEAGTNSTKSDEVGAEDVSLARSPIKTGQECRSEARTNGASDAGYKRGLMQWPAKARE